MNSLVTYSMNYSVETLAPWINSAIANVKSADEIIIATPDPGIVYRVPEMFPQVRVIHLRQYESSGTAWVNRRDFIRWRFKHLAQILPPTDDDLVIVTDSRDVVFQADPFVKLREYEAKSIEPFSVVASGEGIAYGYNDWNTDDMKKLIGDLWEDEFDVGNEVFNAGVIAGLSSWVKYLARIVWLGCHRSSEAGDQAMYNLALRGMKGSQFRNHRTGWTLQGEGAKLDPAPQYKIVPRKGVVNMSNEVIAILHQWDRLPDVEKYVTKKYGRTP